MESNVHPKASANRSCDVLTASKVELDRHVHPLAEELMTVLTNTVAAGDALALTLERLLRHLDVVDQAVGLLDAPEIQSLLRRRIQKHREALTEAMRELSSEVRKVASLGR